jgi:predicted  nucleic acid-binding Zn-ribbon protein
MPITHWQCVECDHLNRGLETDGCFKCGSNLRRRITPVKIANAQQGTPSYDELADGLAQDEVLRETAIDEEEQLKQLIDGWYQEKSQTK